MASFITREGLSSLLSAWLCCCRCIGRCGAGKRQGELNTELLYLKSYLVNSQRLGRFPIFASPNNSNNRMSAFMACAVAFLHALVSSFQSSGHVQTARCLSLPIFTSHSRASLCQQRPQNFPTFPWHGRSLQLAAPPIRAPCEQSASRFGSRGESRDRKPTPARWPWHSGHDRVPVRSVLGTAHRHC